MPLNILQYSRLVPPQFLLKKHVFLICKRNRSKVESTKYQADPKKNIFRKTKVQKEHWNLPKNYLKLSWLIFPWYAIHYLKNAKFKSYQYLEIFKIIPILHLPIFENFPKYTNMVLPIFCIGKIDDTNISKILVLFFEYW